jgi:hypothetical protein
VEYPRQTRRWRRLFKTVWSGSISSRLARGHSGNREGALVVYNVQMVNEHRIRGDATPMDPMEGKNVDTKCRFNVDREAQSLMD